MKNTKFFAPELTPMPMYGALIFDDRPAAGTSFRLFSYQELTEQQKMELQRRNASIQYENAQQPAETIADNQEPPQVTKNIKEKTKKKEKGKNGFTKHVRKVLKGWIDRHSKNPYPTPTEKAALMKTTGLSKTQLNTWMTNNRIRNKMLRTMV